MKLVPLVCEKCNGKMWGAGALTGVACPACGAAYLLGKGGLERVPAKYPAGPAPQGADVVYVPFWREVFEFKITKKESEHLLKKETEASRSEEYDMKIPAFELRAEALQGLALESVSWNQELKEKPPPGARFANISLSEKDARKLAQFVAGCIEVKKEGVMQALTYEAAFQKSELVFLPFRWKEGNPYGQLFDLEGRNETQASLSIP